MTPVLESHSSLSQILLVRDVAQQGRAAGVGRLGLIDFPGGGVLVRLQGRWEVCPWPQTHTIQFILDFAPASAGWSH